MGGAEEGNGDYWGREEEQQQPRRRAFFPPPPRPVSFRVPNQQHHQHQLSSPNGTTTVHHYPHQRPKGGPKEALKVSNNGGENNNSINLNYIVNGSQIPVTLTPGEVGSIPEISIAALDNSGGGWGQPLNYPEGIQGSSSTIRRTIIKQEPRELSCEQIVSVIVTQPGPGCGGEGGVDLSKLNYLSSLACQVGKLELKEEPVEEGGGGSMGVDPNQNQHQVCIRYISWSPCVM